MFSQADLFRSMLILAGSYEQACPNPCRKAISRVFHGSTAQYSFLLFAEATQFIFYEPCSFRNVVGMRFMQVVAARLVVEEYIGNVI